MAVGLSGFYSARARTLRRNATEGVPYSANAAAAAGALLLGGAIALGAYCSRRRVK